MREIKVEDEKLEANQRSEAYLLRAGHPTLLHTSLPHAAAAMLPAANRIFLPLPDAWVDTPPPAHLEVKKEAGTVPVAAKMEGSP